MDDDSAASARALAALHSDHISLVAETTNIRISLESVLQDFGPVRVTVGNLVERSNILSTEYRLLQASIAREFRSLQTSIDAIHLRVVVLERRLSTVEAHLDLNALD